MFFNSDLSLSQTPISKVIAGTTPTSEELEQLKAILTIPLSISLNTKDKKTFDALIDNLVDVSMNVEDRPVVTINFNKDGWEFVAVQWLKGLANAIKANPKSVSKQMRMFSSLIQNKMPEQATGDPKVDGPRQIVIDQTVMRVSPGVVQELERRFASWSNSRR